MQVLVIAVQNAVDYRDLGVATSGNTLFRSVGGSVGTAVLGAIFAARLAVEVAGRMPGQTFGAHGGASLQGMALLPPAARASYVAAFAASIDVVFLVATALAAVGFAMSWLLPERPLRQTVAATSEAVGREVGGAMAMPIAPEPDEELVRGLAAVVDRDVRRRHIERIAERAGVGLSAPAAWLLVRLDECDGLPLAVVTRRSPFDATATREAIAELRTRALVHGSADEWRVTSAGCDALGALVAARRAHLAEVFREWTPGERQELAALLKRLTPQLVPDARSSAARAAG
jgi:hypothetical protein